MNKEYIEREAVIQEIMNAQESLEFNIDKEWTKNKPCFKGLAWANRIILDAQAADVEPVRHGEWISIVSHFHGKPTGKYYCSVCHRVENIKGIYCRLCGARMDGGKK